jgi:hypothetical protein
MSEGSARRLVAAIMAEQFGAAHRHQLLGAGMTRHSIQRDVAGGLLIPMHHSVYVDAAAPPIRKRDIMAATLWGGSSAAAASVTGC